jgi:hypothetical protein
MPAATPAGELGYTDYRARYEALTGRSLRTCPVCGMQSMREIERITGCPRAGADTS